MAQIFKSSNGMEPENIKYGCYPGGVILDIEFCGNAYTYHSKITDIIYQGKTVIMHSTIPNDPYHVCDLNSIEELTVLRIIKHLAKYMFSDVGSYTIRRAWADRYIVVLD